MASYRLLVRYCALLLLAVAVLAPGLSADGSGDITDKTEKQPHRIPRIDGKVKINGVLDEDVWQKAFILEMNFEVRPGENVPPPVKTEALLAFGDRHLYVAFRAKDDNPDEIRAHVSDRDRISEDDWVAIILDSFNDERRNYFFACNPLGIQWDAIESPEEGGEAFDAIWESAGRITDDGYVVEMAIPFRSIGFQRTEGDQVWGVDGVRGYPRGAWHLIGAFPRDRNNNCYLCQAEKIVGFAGATPGRNIEFDPTFSSVYTQERSDFPDGKMVEQSKANEPGLTAKWGFTPNLTLNATVNPDFSNIEADEVQLSINEKYALSVDEKRPFFVEGADFFSTRLRAVYTRSLAAPDWGIKLTGKEGANAIGFYSVRDSRTNFILPFPNDTKVVTLEEESYGSVLRYRRDVGRSSTVGLLLTDREADNYYNRVVGLDADVLLSQKDRVRFQVLRSETDDPSGVSEMLNRQTGSLAGSAFDVRYDYDSEHLGIVGHWKQVDNYFRADLGFMPQAGYRGGEIFAEYCWRSDQDNWYSLFMAGGGMDFQEDLDGNLIYRSLMSWMNYEGPLQSSLNVYTEFGTEGFDYKEFGFGYIEAEAEIRPSGDLTLTMSVEHGDKVDFEHSRPGVHTLAAPGIAYRLGRHLELAYDHTYEHLNVEGGRLYTANIDQLRAVYQFNRRTFLRAILQRVDFDFNQALYTSQEVNSEERSLFSQILFSYKINPQTVLFLGYSDNYEGNQGINLTQRDRTFFGKIGYALVL